jgi:hypothetical protein
MVATGMYSLLSWGGLALLRKYGAERTLPKLPLYAFAP